MPSPFPGMNPYLEQDDVWHDFHERALPAAAESIGLQVQPDYIVKIDEHVYIHELPSRPRRLIGRADLGVAPARPPGEARAGVGLLDAPAHVRLPAEDVEHESFIEIRDRRSRELVCVIELLSPSNKRTGPDREQYLIKRRQILNSPAHLVEIDLLRGGEAMPSEDRPPCTYSVMVSRAGDRPVAGFWSIGPRDSLPVIPIPLRAGHADARLDLQALLHRIYDAAGYQYDIYEGTPSPNLAPDDLAWTRQFIPPPPP
jgi:Protein of unknown function (DUF4058)